MGKKKTSSHTKAVRKRMYRKAKHLAQGQSIKSRMKKDTVSPQASGSRDLLVVPKDRSGKVDSSKTLTSENNSIRIPDNAASNQFGETSGSLKKLSLYCLLGSGELGDEIINAYLEENAKLSCLNVIAVDALAWAPGMPGDTVKNITDLSRSKNYNFDVVLMPIHLPGHWTLAVLCKSERSLRYYDSLHPRNIDTRTTQHLKFICSCLGVEEADYELSLANRYIGHQEDGHSCGVFVCFVGRQICFGEPTILPGFNPHQYRQAICSFFENHEAYTITYQPLSDEGFLEKPVTEGKIQQSDDVYILDDSETTVAFVTHTVPLTSENKQSRNRKRYSSEVTLELDKSKKQKTATHISDATNPSTVSGKASTETRKALSTVEFVNEYFKAQTVKSKPAILTVDPKIWQHTIRKTARKMVFGKLDRSLGFRLLLIPVQYNPDLQDHWAAAVLDVSESQLYYYDVSAKQKIDTKLANRLQRICKDLSASIPESNIRIVDISAVVKAKIEIYNSLFLTCYIAKAAVEQQSAVVSFEKFSLKEVRADLSSFLEASSLGHLEDIDEAISQKVVKQIKRARKSKKKKFVYAEKHHCGPLNAACLACGALYFKYEFKRFNFCCFSGSISLPEIPQPDFLKELTTQKKFVNQIVGYNDAFSLCAMSYNKVPVPFGPPVVRLKGQILYNPSHLFPARGQPRYAQLYIYKHEEATEKRTEMYANLETKILSDLDIWFRNNNIYAKCYLDMKTFYDQTVDDAKRKGQATIPEVRMVLISDIKTLSKFSDSVHPGRLNAPPVEQVCAIYSTDDSGEPPSNYGVWVFPKQGKKTASRMDHCNPLIYALKYPLLFPSGFPVYSYGIRYIKPKPSKKSKKCRKSDDLENSDVTENYYPEVKHRDFVSEKEWILFHMRYTQSSFHWLWSKGTLAQYLTLTAFLKIESRRLDELRKKAEFRAEDADKLIPFVTNKLEKAGYKIGKAIVMSQKYPQGRRHMEMLYQDVMAMVSKLGKPHLFITMTANPDWPEIKENLKPGQHWTDNPYIMNRVFYIKFQALMDDILKKKIFGEVKCYALVPEFQKRGCPHIHLIVTLADEDALKTGSDIDDVIQAIIPEKPDLDDPDYDMKMKLHNAVIQHMVHNPCEGKTHYACYSKKTGKCKRHFPQPYSEFTTLNETGYAIMRRPEDGIYAMCGKKKDIKITHQNIVPYSPYLLMKYDCHINVEYCGSMKVVKYLYRYILKGFDTGIFKIVEWAAKIADPKTRIVDFDETELFQQMRFLTPCEAMWRLLGYLLHKCSHTIIRFSVHLPGQHKILYKPGKAKKALANARKKEAPSELIAFFNLNRRDKNARQYTMPEIFKYYKYDGRKGKFIKRKQKIAAKIIVRCYTVLPNNMQKFALRTLIHHVKGPTCFQDLKVDQKGNKYGTFHEAALARGLLSSDAEWEKCLTEGDIYLKPGQLRFMFSTILIFCTPSDPLALWKKFRSQLIDGYGKDRSEEYCEQRALAHIQHILSEHDKSCEDFDLPNPETSIFNEFTTNDGLSIEEITQLYETDYGILNNEQLSVIHTISNAVGRPKEEEKCYYLRGRGGSGKTKVLNCLLYKMKIEGKNAKAISFTGIAATLLFQGQTIHSSFKFGLKLDKDLTSNVKANSELGNALRDLDLLIIDEISMVPGMLFEAINRTLKDLAAEEYSNVPFGGVTVLTCGDFQQLLPITEDESIPASVISETVKATPSWAYFSKNTLLLQKNMRTGDSEKQFSAFLDKLGNGDLQEKNGYEVKLAKRFLAENENEVIDSTFPKHILSNVMKDSETMKQATSSAILTTTNADAYQINEIILNRMKGEERVYNAIDTPLEDTEEDYWPGVPVEALSYFTPSGYPPFALKLKVGAVIILLRNLNTKQGLVNGSRFVVIEMREKCLICLHIHQNGSTSVVALHRIPLKYIGKKDGYAFTRLQFPVRLAFCMTINKAQGQTFDKVGVILRTPVFSHGQLYVAFSRVRKASDILVYTPEKAAENGTKTIPNIIYKAILQ